MTSNQLDFYYNGADDFGLGFDIVTEKNANQNLRSLGTYSRGGYMVPLIGVDPKEKLVCLIMIQHTPNRHADLMNKITSVIYSAFEKLSFCYWNCLFL